MNETKAQEFENDIGGWDWFADLENRVPVISATDLMDMTVEPREFVLRDCGITYRSRRSNGQRLVEINYSPPAIEVTEGTQVTQNIGGIENASLASLATL